ncbi:hypothetical protein LTR70_008425 [Exophiala xenobiotica]|uniref:Prenylcysteine lyase domain-containing protein n=1 Tax=Lithohypha guttulata TaxID=1690604 RepID=A0ABR0KDN9_9EURO|nr:hypothetical protein LTR24_003805 [Lithohypha guttulata]KAK5312072.1 hypothetical protein LTR70_008425 [Exophiala xenobiotica]
MTIRRVINVALTCLIAVFSHAAAQQDQSPLTPPTDDSPQPYRVAIIGAGAAGSSAAFHLSQFANTSSHSLPPLDITIFEATDHIGGRTTTVNALNDARYPVELGASIFVEINAILFNATRDFNLPANNRLYESTGAELDLGVWDGESFVFTVANRDEEAGRLKGTLGNWWDIAKLLWKYGLSPIRLRSLQQSTIGKFLKMYDEAFPFNDLTKAAEDVDLLSTTGQSGTEMLAAAGVSEKFSREIIQASSRVNYAQNLNDFHGLETMVCMSTEGAMSIEGGNWQIFNQMVQRSGAKIKYNTTVTSIASSSESPNQKPAVHHHDHNTGQNRTTHTHTHTHTHFDTVILAAPLNISAITLHPPPSNPPNHVDYVPLHVTLFTTPHRPSPLFFNLPSSSTSTSPTTLPDTILTTLPRTLDPALLPRGPPSVGPTTFWSLSTLRTLHPSTDGFDLIPRHVESGHIPLENLQLNTTQYLYKIFSPAPLTTDFMNRLFGWDDNDNTLHPLSSLQTHPFITWSHERTWLSYPYLPPTTSFDHFDLYSSPSSSSSSASSSSSSASSSSSSSETSTSMSGRIWYTSGMERFISTMETSALAGRNVARLIVDGLEGRGRREGMKGIGKGMGG